MTELRAVDGAAEDTQSWDDFWADVTPAKPRTEVICGVEVLVPTDMPLNLQARLGELEQSENEDDFHELIGMLFGDGALADWIDAGMTLRQLQTVLVWGIHHANGKPISFREAHEKAAAQEGKAQPANRAARRAAVRSRSAATGGRSRPTSSGSTASRGKTSRG